MTTAPISSGRDAKHSPISRMMPSLSALRLAGRFRPTVRTRSTLSICSSPEAPAPAVSAIPCVICVLVRIVMLYNEFGRSQGGLGVRGGRMLFYRLCRPGEGQAKAGTTAEVVALPEFREPPLSHHLMHVDHDAVGMPRGGADENVLHQPAIFLVPRLESRHGAEIDQLGINRLAALELLQELDRAEAHALVLDIDDGAVVGLEGVFGLEVNQLVGADGLEVSAEGQHLA